MLQDWLLHARTAITVRHAAIREAYDKDRFANARNCEHKQKKAKGEPAKRTIEATLGKRRPKQRMWGISGPVIMGVQLVLQQNQYLECLRVLIAMPTSTSVVCIIGDNTGVQLWFRGPRYAGDFLAQWCSE